MEIDNDRNATRAKTLLISIPFVLMLGSGLLAIFRAIYTWIPTIGSGLLVILGWGIIVVLSLKSVKFKFNNETLTILYYPISPMTYNFKRIEIAATRLIKYEIITSFFGIRKELVLYENINGEEASYPPVSLTLYGKESVAQIENLIKSLCS